LNSRFNRTAQLNPPDLYQSQRLRGGRTATTRSAAKSNHFEWQTPEIPLKSRLEKNKYQLSPDKRDLGARFPKVREENHKVIY